MSSSLVNSLAKVYDPNPLHGQKLGGRKPSPTGPDKSTPVPRPDSALHNVESRMDSLSSQMERMLSMQNNVLSRLDGLSQDLGGVGRDLASMRAEVRGGQGSEVVEVVCRELRGVVEEASERMECQGRRLEGVEKLMEGMQQMISLIGEVVKNSRLVELLFKEPGHRASKACRKLKDNKGKDGKDKAKLNLKGLKAQKKRKPPDTEDTAAVLQEQVEKLNRQNAERSHGNTEAEARRGESLGEGRMEAVELILDEPRAPVAQPEDLEDEEEEEEEEEEEKKQRVKEKEEEDQGGIFENSESEVKEEKEKGEKNIKEVAPEPVRHVGKAPEPVGEVGKALEPVGDVGKALEPVGEVRKAPELVGEVRKAPEPVGHVGKAPEPVRDVGKAPELVGHVGKAPEPVGEVGKAPEPVGDSGKAPEPVGDSGKAPEPVGDSGKAPEPVGDSGKALEPVGDTGKAPEPVGDVGKAPELVGDSGKTPEPVGDMGKEEEKKSEGEEEEELSEPQQVLSGVPDIPSQICETSLLPQERSEVVGEVATSSKRRVTEEDLVKDDLKKSRVEERKEEGQDGRELEGAEPQVAQSDEGNPEMEEEGRDGEPTVKEYIIDSSPPPLAPFDHRIVTPKAHQVATFYTINREEVLGGGRFGQVHKCVEITTGLMLAAKIIKARSQKEKEVVKNEIQVMNQLNHANLIQLYAAFESRYDIILVMEYVDGGELFDRIIDENYNLTELDTVLFIRQICEGLQYMHKMYILHLDLKPENILCVSRATNKIKIIDFGLARRYKPREKLRVNFGTPEFLAPEVINYEFVSFPTDMWSLGVITYMLLSGLSPFLGDDDNETLNNILACQWNFEEEEFLDISEEAKDFITRLLVKSKCWRMSAAESLRHPWLSDPSLHYQLHQKKNKCHSTHAPPPES